MKRYVHNPELFRHHFTGQGLPAFKGKRLQRGRGALSKKLKRYAVPILSAGIKAAAPHVSKTAKQLAAQAARQAFGNNPAMQNIASNVTGHIIDKAINKIGGKKNKRKSQSKPRVSRKLKSQATTQQNVFKNVPYR